MAGCAMIGQSVINVKSGGRGRLSAFSAGVFLLLMVVFAGAWVAQIPMAALVAVMIMVAIGTFNWGSIKNLRDHPKTSSMRSEEHTSELQSLMRISYAVFCLKKKKHI